jgi:hypothetical protein
MKPLKFKRVTKDWHKADEMIADAMVAAWMHHIKRLDAKIEQQAKQIKQLETATAFPFKYRGVWKQGPYRMNESATYKGCLWIALVSTETKPGESRHWQLAVKAGRDGKDAR